MMAHLTEAHSFLFPFLRLGIVDAVRYSEKRLLVWPEKYCVEIMKITMGIYKQNNYFKEKRRKSKTATGELSFLLLPNFFKIKNHTPKWKEMWIRECIYVCIYGQLKLSLYMMLWKLIQFNGWTHNHMSWNGQNQFNFFYKIYSAEIFK